MMGILGACLVPTFSSLFHHAPTVPPCSRCYPQPHCSTLPRLFQPPQLFHQLLLFYATPCAPPCPHCFILPLFLHLTLIVLSHPTVRSRPAVQSRPTVLSRPPVPPRSHCFTSSTPLSPIPLLHLVSIVSAHLHCSIPPYWSNPLPQGHAKLPPDSTTLHRYVNIFTPL